MCNLTQYVFFFLQSRNNGFCLDNYRNGNIGTYQCGSSLWQKWEIIPASRSTSKIKNMATNKVIMGQENEGVKIDAIFFKLVCTRPFREKSLAYVNTVIMYLYEMQCCCYLVHYILDNIKTQFKTDQIGLANSFESQF